MVQSQTGITPELFIGKTHHELGFPKDLCILWEDVIGKVFETGEVKRLEFLLPTGIWIDWLLAPEIDDQDRVVAVVTSARDITERKRAEEALRESEEKYRQLFMNAPAAIFEVDFSNSCFISFNEITPTLSGYSREELMQMVPWDLFTEESRYTYLERMKLIKEGMDVSSSQEYEIRKKDGGILWVNMNIDYTIEDGLLVRARIVAHDVTERKRAEEELRKTNQTLQAIIDASPLAIFTLNHDLRVTSWSPAAERIFGWSREEAIGQYNPIVPKEKWDEFKALVSIVLSGVGYSDNEVKRQTKDGHAIDVNVSTEPLRDAHGKVVGAMGVIQDITKRKRDEEALRDNEEKFRTLVDNLNMGVYRNTGDLQGRFIQANPAMIKMFGYDSLEEFIKIAVTDLYQDPEERRLFIEEIRRYGYVKDKELAMRKKDGGLMWVSISATAQRDEEGEIKWMDGVVEDITERKKIEVALRESEQRLKLILHGSPIATFVIGRDHRVIHWNDALEQLSGIKAGAIIGTEDQWRAFYDRERPCLADLIVDGSLKTIPEWYSGKYNKSKLIDEAYEATDLFPSLGDKGKWLRFTAAAIRNPAGDLIGAIETLEDITDRILAEEERNKLEAQLTHAHKMESIGTLAGGIAHDFNNILSAIFGYTQLAMYDVSDPEKARKELKEVLKAGDRAKNLVNQILTFSRKADAKYSPISLTKTVMDSIKMMRSVLPTTIDIRHDLIDYGLVLADPTQIHQVMMNLCTNAAHAMDKTGGVMEVRLRRVELDEGTQSGLNLPLGAYLWLCVSDTGHGMTPEVMARIFDPYFTTKEVGRGTGLGLAVVHGIVQSHGGTITCTSSPGKGTTFDIYLPEILSEEAVMSHHEERPLPSGTERILFVDDEPILVKLADNMLSKLGYTVVTRSSSSGALELFQKDPDKYDLVITDMTMPGMTGDRLAQKLMEIHHDIPIILCSGYSEHISEEKAKNIGIRAFVMKPLEMKELAITIRKILDGG
jgi:PAS domain S-box-containing protein